MRISGLLPIAVIGVAACKGDDGLVVHHEPPIVSITQPSEGASFYDGEPVEFRALASSSIDEATSLTARWVTGTTTMCESAAVEADGTSICSYSFSVLAEQSVTVTVTDTRGDASSASVMVNILENTPPLVEITAPADGSSFQPGELVVLDALVDDFESDPDEIVVDVSSSIDGDLGFTAAPASDGSFTAATSSLTNGQHLIVVRASDPSGRSGQDSIRVTVNGKPGAPGVEITPDPSPSGQELRAVVATPSVDPEGDAITYTYDWYVDGVLYSSGTNPKVPLGVTVRDEFWEVYVTPFDSFTYGPPGTANIAIDNSPPKIDSVSVTPSSPSTSDDLTATPSGWFDQDSDTEKYRMRWYKNGTLDTSETTSVFPASKTLRGDMLQAEFTPYDAYEDGDPVLSPTVTVGNGAPTAPGVKITPSAPQPSDDLTCAVTTPSTDIDGDAITYTFEWWQNGSKTTITSYIVDDTYTVHGDVWECRIYASDGLSTGAYGTASVDVLDTVKPAAPVITAPKPFRNETSATLTGTCEASCELTFYCADSLASWTETDTCTSSGTFSHTVALDRGEVTDCWADCEDAAGNISALSNAVDTEVCDPYDIYEDTAGYGDTIAAKIDLWSTMPDDKSVTVTILGNGLDYSDEDWYLVTTKDDNTKNVAANQNDYNFEILMTKGSSAYEFKVYKASSVSSGYPTTPECSTTSGITEYDDYVTTRACRGTNTLGYNLCEDMSDAYYIQVKHLASVSLSCQEYELTITNGVW